MQKKQIDLTSEIMSRIEMEQIKMKPRWYFVLGSSVMTLGLSSVFIVLMFITRIFIFSIRSHGPMGDIRLQQLISSFPLWTPIVAIIGIIAGIFLLRKYDFSYKKNFGLIILGIVTAIVLSGFMIDKFNLDNAFFVGRFGQGAGRSNNRLFR